MAKSIRTQTPPTLVGKSNPVFDNSEFSAAVWNKGLDVIVEEAVECPCKTDDNDYLATNYKGSHYFKKLSRNFVYRDGHAKTIQGISTSNGTNLTDPRFIKIETNVNQTKQWKSWAPFD